MGSSRFEPEEWDALREGMVVPGVDWTDPAEVETSEMVYVRMVTSEGDVVLTLDAGKAPITVANFLTYVDEGFYALFSPSGDREFTASATGYTDDVDTVTVVANDTVGHDFSLDAGQLTASPPVLSAWLYPSSTTNQTLIIENTGNVNANYDLFEVSGTTADVVSDGSFEGGTPNANWNEYSLNFSTPICDSSCGVDGAHTGSWYVWFGGTASEETGSVDQDVTIPVGYATLNFWLLIGAASGADGFMAVSLDGTELFRVTENDAADYGVYTLVTVDASAFADGGTHNLRFDAYNVAGANLNFFVDDVTLNVDSGINWLVENPVSGVVTAGGQVSVDVTFDSNPVGGPGEYTGDLLLTSDTPYANLTIPVTMTVVMDYAWNGSVDTDWDNTANWTPNGVPDAFSRVSIDPANLSGASVWPVLNVDAVAFDLTLAAGAELTIPNSRTLTVHNALSNQGLLRQTKDIASATLTRFLQITGNGGTAYYGVDITPAGAMGLTTVEIRGNQTAGCNQGDQLIHRCFDITPATPRTATVRFWYLDVERNGEDNNFMQAYHWNDATGLWDRLDAGGELRGSEGSYHFVEVDGVSEYSPFGLADSSPSDPTAVTMQSFSANNNSMSIVLLFVAGFVIFLSWIFAKRRFRTQ